MPVAADKDATFEGETWAKVQGTWQQLHGSYSESGVSIEWHEFKLTKALAWSESFHPESIEICLNLAGPASFRDGLIDIQLPARSVAIYAPHRDLRATREGRGSHRFLTIELSREYLAKKLTAHREALRPGIKAFLSGDTRDRALLDTWAMPAGEQAALAQWTPPAVTSSAKALWYEAKVLDVLARVAFQEPEQPEMFCDRQKRLGRERMERVIEILKLRLQEPPSLEELGREVGCSPFYLSRTFSGHAGQTIPQYIRQLRMERAAELLREGRMNVTEVAFEVGYSSLGHFSKSFCEVIGVCPSLYPAASALARPARGLAGTAIQR